MAALECRTWTVRSRRFYLYESFSRLPHDLLNSSSPKTISPHPAERDGGNQTAIKTISLRGVIAPLCAKKNGLWEKHFPGSSERTAGNFMRGFLPRNISRSAGGTFSDYTLSSAVIGKANQKQPAGSVKRFCAVGFIASTCEGPRSVRPLSRRSPGPQSGFSIRPAGSDPPRRRPPHPPSSSPRRGSTPAPPRSAAGR
jgi:hypothetical protein